MRTGPSPFHTVGVFLYPLKTLDNQRFSDIFRGCRKAPVKVIIDHS